MIPATVQRNLFPSIATDAKTDAAILLHDCGLRFIFKVEVDTRGDAADWIYKEPYWVTEQHLNDWNAEIRDVAQIAGANCFSYNTLPADPDGVFHNTDGNTFAILFAPGTFLEHNRVDGKPILLVISESECILTGDKSETGLALIEQHRQNAQADRVVTIDSKWQNWNKLQAAE